MYDIPGVILAGGLSRRMGGGDKTLLPLGGTPILSHAVRRLKQQVTSVYLNANGDPTRFAPFGLSVLPDPLPDHPGPLAGVLAGMDHGAAMGADWVVTIAGDTPFFPLDLVKILSEAIDSEDKPIALAATETAQRVSLHPTFGMWAVALRKDLRQALEGGTRKVLAWTDRHGVAKALFPGAPFDPFLNINTAEDLQAAEDILRSEA